MMLDFGVSPNCIDEMSLGQVSSMMSALRERRGRAKMPSESERKAALDEFLSAVSDDSSVRVH